jgi:hypothetical protein
MELGVAAIAIKSNLSKTIFGFASKKVNGHSSKLDKI